MENILKNIELVNNKKFTGSMEELKDLIINLEAKSLFDKENWTETDNFILKYLNLLNDNYKLDKISIPNKRKSIAVIGSIPKDMPKDYGFNYSNEAYKNLRKKIKIQFYKDKVTDVYVGVSQGVEWCVAHAVIEMRELGFPIKLNCVIPCSNYDKFFTNQSLILYENIIRRADSVNYSSKEEYTKDSYLSNNNFLINKNNDIYIFSGNDEKYQNEFNLIKSKNKKLTKINIV